MKKDIVYFVAYCDICNKVKAEHQKPARLLQPLPVLSDFGFWQTLEVRTLGCT